LSRRLRSKGLFLEVGPPSNLLLFELDSIRHDNQLVIPIVKTLDHGDTPTSKPVKPLVHTEHVPIELLAITGHHPRDVAVVGRIGEAMLWMARAPGQSIAATTAPQRRSSEARSASYVTRRCRSADLASGRAAYVPEVHGSTGSSGFDDHSAHDPSYSDAFSCPIR